MNDIPSKQDDEKYCSDCAAVIKAKAEICPKCGIRQQSACANQPSSGRNRIGASLFALFLGGFGIHKFYLGRVGQGVLYLLFCWTFIPVLLGFIEAIIYLTMSDEAFSLKYND